MHPKQRGGEPQDANSNVVPFTTAGRRRMVMVPEDEWREVLTVVRQWGAVRKLCPVARRIVEEEG